mmetsp:Transcript_19797/g.45529  ORF Transcript_19797/g.45529 Transcript_19797/m.45529 type:complete len:308 (-) Transcript_19797:983-1906(-)
MDVIDSRPLATSDCCTLRTTRTNPLRMMYVCVGAVPCSTITLFGTICSALTFIASILIVSFDTPAQSLMLRSNCAFSAYLPFARSTITCILALSSVKKTHCCPLPREHTAEVSSAACVCGSCTPDPNTAPASSDHDLVPSGSSLCTIAPFPSVMRHSCPNTLSSCTSHSSCSRSICLAAWCFGVFSSACWALSLSSAASRSFAIAVIPSVKSKTETLPFKSKKSFFGGSLRLISCLPPSTFSIEAICATLSFSKSFIDTKGSLGQASSTSTMAWSSSCCLSLKEVLRAEMHFCDTSIDASLCPSSPA